MRLSRLLIVCSLFTALVLIPVALAFADVYDYGGGGGPYEGVPDEIQTRLPGDTEPPPPPPQDPPLRGHSGGSTLSISQSSFTLDAATKTSTWRTFLWVVEQNLKALVIRY